MQHLNGLLMPTEGRVIVNGVNIKEKGAALRELRKQVGLVFQYPEYQLFEETVAKDIAFGPKNIGCSKEEDRRARALGVRAGGYRLRDDGQGIAV